MIDLHAHLLPGVDDGPESWDEAIAMVRMAAQDGITAMVATSHMIPTGPYANTREHLLALVGELNERLRNAGIDIPVYPGAEVHMTADVVDRLERGELLTYCDAGRYMLLEMPASEMPGYALQVIEDLRLKGITPIIPHPERNLDIMREPSRAFSLVESGGLLQVTASSIGAVPPVRTVTQFLFRHGLVHFIATDAHGVDRRRPRLKVHLEKAREWIDSAIVERMVLHNPASVLAGEPIDASRLANGPVRRGLWHAVVRRFVTR